MALLDIGLPEIDGYELARRLRAISKLRDIRLIALTGYGQMEDRKRALAAGFDLSLGEAGGLYSPRTHRGGLPMRVGSDKLWINNRGNNG